MKLFGFQAAWMAWIFFHAFAPPVYATDENVVLITIDGVRYQEFFHGVRRQKSSGLKRGSPVLPWLDSRVENGKAFVYGRSLFKDPFYVSNPTNLSLPGYRSILSGQVEKTCKSNDCPNIDQETVFDFLVQNGFKSNELVAVSSWPGIDLAIESIPGQITKNIAASPVIDSKATPEEQAWIDQLNKNMLQNDVPTQWHESRFDRYTFEVGLYYLKKNLPRFLYLSFLDTDEWGHLNNYRNYIQSLRNVNDYLARLDEALLSMGEYGRHTSIVITTDHGRNPGPLWYNHGPKIPTAHRAWAAVVPSQSWLENNVRPRTHGRFRHTDIRPTIERLLKVDNNGRKQGPGSALIK